MLGLSFALGGDWQVEPHDVRTTELLDLLNARILAPQEATCTITGNKLDYVIISTSLLSGNEEASVTHGLQFTPHIPVQVRLTTGARRSTIDVLPRPRPLPVERPIGPVFPGATIDWEHWRQRRRVQEGCEDFANCQTELLTTWYAGAEAELTTVMGLFGDEDESAYLGLGRTRGIQKQPQRGKYRDVTFDMGMLGVRLSWSSNALRTAARYARIMHGAWERSGNEDGQRERDTIWILSKQLWAIGNRARAMAGEKRKVAAEDRPEWEQVWIALDELARLCSKRGTDEPLVGLWSSGRGYDKVDRLNAVAKQTEKAWQIAHL